MSSAQAAVEVFLAAYRSLPARSRSDVLRRILAGREHAEERADIARWLERRQERAVSYTRVRRALKSAGRL